MEKNIEKRFQWIVFPIYYNFYSPNRFIANTPCLHVIFSTGLVD